MASLSCMIVSLIHSGFRILAAQYIMAYSYPKYDINASIVAHGHNLFKSLNNTDLEWEVVLVQVT